MMKLLWELVRKDLRIFIADRRSVMISFVTPTVLACFIAFLMGSANSGGPTKIAMGIVDNDHSEFSKNLIDKLSASSAFDVSQPDETKAQAEVLKGDLPFAIVIPSGFGKQAAQAMTQHTDGPQYRFLADPTRQMQVAVGKGMLMNMTMQVLSKQVYGNLATSDEKHMPFKVDQQDQTREGAAKWSMAAHAFAGMAIQGLLFWAIESAMTIMRERRMGLWKRMRAAPVSPRLFLLGKAISATIRAIAVLAVVFGVGMAVFNFRITPSIGSYVGFGLVAITASLMTAAFGLFVAALGKNEQQSRGLSILAVLGMCMLGGAWFPMEFMPSFMQSISKFVPISWAITGFDSMTWRGGDFAGLLPGIGIMLAFAVAFGVIADRRIKWEPEAG